VFWAKERGAETGVWCCAAHKPTSPQGNNRFDRQKASAQRRGVTAADTKLICHFSFVNAMKISHWLTAGVSSAGSRAGEECSLAGSFHRCGRFLVG